MAAEYTNNKKEQTAKNDIDSYYSKSISYDSIEKNGYKKFLLLKTNMY